MSAECQLSEVSGPVYERRCGECPVRADELGGGFVAAGDSPRVDRRCWFPKLSSAFAASSLSVVEVGTGQLARIVEREPTPPLAA